MKFKMRRTLFAKILGIVTFGSVVIVSFGQGCGRLVSTQGSMNASSSGAEGGSTPASSYLPNTNTLGLVYGKEILNHFSSCLGSGNPSDRTLAVYGAKSGTVSSTGQISTLTSAMLMASASIAGEVCEDLIQNEKISPRMFIGIDLNSTALPQASALQDAMRRIARSCWSRDEDPTESQIIMSAVNDSFAGAPAAANTAHDAVLFMCTAQVAALDALIL